MLLHFLQAVVACYILLFCYKAIKAVVKNDRVQALRMGFFTGLCGVASSVVGLLQLGPLWWWHLTMLAMSIPVTLGLFMQYLRAKDLLQK